MEFPYKFPLEGAIRGRLSWCLPGHSRVGTVDLDTIRRYVHISKGGVNRADECVAIDTELSEVAPSLFHTMPFLARYHKPNGIQAIRLRLRFV